MESFQVFARIRPLNQKQKQIGLSKGQVNVLDNSVVQVADNIFQLDHVFQANIDNYQLFQNVVKPLTDQFLAGINTTVFAYGITGAGKSHTMFGNNNEAGLIQLTLDELCAQAQMNQNVTLTISYLQIYNQQVYDLLRSNSISLQILDDPTMGVVVPDLQQKKIHNSQMALELIRQGNTRRVVAQTRANQYSSRSHAIVQLGIQRQTNEGVLVSKMSLVDLAGSQKQNVYTQVKGLRNIQGSNINRSLLTLGNCITMLSQRGRNKGGFVPYRDSKLTRLLKDSLGGNTKTAMIACIFSTLLFQEQTINTLKYATRARKIQKVIKKNIMDRRPNQQLKRQILRLREQLQMKNSIRTIPLKQQMMKRLRQLIQNTENITRIKMQSSGLFTDNLRQVQLIEEQGQIISTILNLSGCIDSAQTRLKKCNSENIQFQKQNKISISDDVNRRQSYDIYLSKNQKNQKQLKTNSFVKGNLQNRRLQYQQVKKQIKQLENEYVEITNEIQREELIEKANSLLQKNKHLLGLSDIELIQKMINGEQIHESNICQRQILRPLEDIQYFGGGGRQRLMQSLYEVYRMKKRVIQGQESKQKQLFFN